MESLFKSLVLSNCLLCVYKVDKSVFSRLIACFSITSYCFDAVSLQFGRFFYVCVLSDVFVQSER